MQTSHLEKITARICFFAALAMIAPACTGDDSGDTASPDGGAGSVAPEDKPPATPADICAAIATFAGYAELGSAPETDAQGRETVWYVAIPVRNEDELNAIPAAGIPSEFTDSFPPVQNQTADGGTIEPGQKSVCWAPAAAEIEWALVPGPLLNRIIRTQQAQTAPTWEAIEVLSLPSQIANASLTFQGVHPLSDQAAAELGF